MCLSSSTRVLQDRPVREALKASVPCGCEAQEARGLHALRTDASREQRTPAAQMLELELTLRGLFHNSAVAFPPGGPHLVQVAIRLRGGWRLLATACRQNVGGTLGVAHSAVPMDYVIPTERRWIGRVQLRNRPPDTASLPLVGSPGQLDVEGALRALRDRYEESSTL